MDKVKPVDVYKRSPTFTLDKELLEEFRDLTMRAIKSQRLALMIDGRNMDWIEEQIAKFPKEEEKVKKPLGV